MFRPLKQKLRNTTGSCAIQKDVYTTVSKSSACKQTGYRSGNFHASSIQEAAIYATDKFLPSQCNLI